MSNHTIGVAIVLFLVISCTNKAASNLEESYAAETRANVKAIQAELRRCMIIRLRYTEEGGGFIYGFFKNDSLQKLTGDFRGETGRTLVSTYFVNTRPAYQTRERDDYYLSLEPDTLFPAIVASHFHEFYFRNDSLLLWLIDGDTISSIDSSYIDKGRQIVDRITFYTKLLENGVISPPMMK